MASESTKMCITEESYEPQTSGQIGRKYCLNCAVFLDTSCIKITHLRRDIITSPPPDAANATSFKETDQRNPKPSHHQQRVVSSYVTTIPEALKYLYKLDLHPELLLPYDLNELILCERCGELLTSLYLIHKEFHKLTYELSFLGQVLNQLTHPIKNTKVSVREIQVQSKIIPSLSASSPKMTARVESDPAVHNSQSDDDQRMDSVNDNDNDEYDEEFNASKNPEAWSETMSEQFRNLLVPCESESKLSCNICHKSIYGKYKMRRHLEAHDRKELIKARGFECGICGKTDKESYIIREHLKTHLGEHDQDSSITYKCRYCYKIYLDLEMYSEHREAEKKEVRHPKQCKACSEYTGGNSSLGSNISGQQIQVACQRHKSLMNLCTICGKSGANNHHHEWTHFNKEERETEKQRLQNPLLCNECGASFPFQFSLNIHIKQCHGPKKPKPVKRKIVERYKCPKCPMSYTTNQSLQLHKRRHNDASKKYLCTYCSQVFEFQTQLTEHVQLDCEEAEADRPYQCSICQKKFVRRDGLRTHIFNVHKLSAVETRQMVYPELTKEPPPDLYIHLNVKRTRKRPAKYLT